MPSSSPLPRTSSTPAIDLTVPGQPRGKGRPKFVRATGRAYTDKKTVNAEGEIVDAWNRAGAVRLPDGPLELDVTAVLERPQGHWKRDGSLSTAGVRSVWPVKKPDVDNIVKLVMDALNGKAYRDDALVVHSVLWKRWANPGETAHLRVRVAPLVGP